MNDWNIKINVDEFLNRLGPLDEISSKYLVMMISNLDIDDRKKILSREEIKNKLKYGILEEANGDFWTMFRSVLDYISVEEFLSLYDVNTLNSYFKGEVKGREYIFFSAMAEKNLNELVRCLLNNGEMFDKFFELSSDYYSAFYSLSDYELFKEIIFKLEKKDFPYSLTFLNCINEEFQSEILKENITDKTVITLLPNFKQSVINDFFMNDYRALYLYDRLNIVNYANNGTTFSDDLLKKKKFFDILFNICLIFNINSILN